MDLTHVQAAIIAAAAVCGALAVLYRSAVRPALRFCSTTRERVDEIKETVQAVHELGLLVARYVGESDTRFRTLEATLEHTVDVAAQRHRQYPTTHWLEADDGPLGEEIRRYFREGPRDDPT